jgi:hypothetical protein
MYEYLAGVILLGAIWSFLYGLRKDLRKVMLWSGIFYVLILTIGFFAHALLVNDTARSIIPGYWAPHTLFNLGEKTGGYSIEDILFMFFVGGIASSIYEVVFRKKLPNKKVKNLKNGHALFLAAVCTAIFSKLFYINDIYLLMAFNISGTFFVLLQRKDLVRHSFYGGILTLLVYIFAFLLMLLVFPDLIKDIYHLQLTSGVHYLGIPLEEYLYAFSFGLLWAPLYEYEHGSK